MPSFFSTDAEDSWNRLVEDVTKRVQEHDSRVGERSLYGLALHVYRCSSLRYNNRCGLLSRSPFLGMGPMKIFLLHHSST